MSVVSGPSIERRFVALFQLPLHVFLDEVHGHVAGAFDHALHVMLPRHLRQLAQRVEFAELGRIVRIGHASGPQAIAQAEGHVVGLHDLADVLEVRIEEILAMMRKAPLRHDGPAARHDAGYSLCRERHEAKEHAGVDREIVHPLLRLLHQRVAEDLPGQFLGDAAHLLQRLIDGHGADRYRGIAHDPFPRLVDVLAGGKIHDGIGTPADRPHELFHFFRNAGTYRAVADVGVHLGEEPAADGHRLRFRVIDVGGNDRAAARDLVAHELRGDARRQRGAERFARMLRAERGIGQRVDPLVLANGHELHLRRDDATPRVMHLGDVRAATGSQRQPRSAEADGVEPRIVRPAPSEARRQGVEPFHVASLGDPCGTQGGEARRKIDGMGGIGIRPGRVVHHDRRIGLAAEQRGGGGLRYFAHRHVQIRAAAGNVHLARTGDGCGNGLGQLARGAGQIGGHGIHRLLVPRRKGEADGAVTRRAVRKRTAIKDEASYAGTDRIRFEGTLSARASLGHPRFAAD